MSQSMPNKGMKLKLKIKKTEQNDPKKIIQRISNFGKTDTSTVSVSEFEIGTSQAQVMANEADDDKLNPNHKFMGKEVHNQILGFLKSPK
jgi:tRNA G46 methylase TrmB